MIKIEHKKIIESVTIDGEDVKDLLSICGIARHMLEEDSIKENKLFTITVYGEKVDYEKCTALIDRITDIIYK